MRIPEILKEITACFLVILGISACSTGSVQRTSTLSLDATDVDLLETAVLLQSEYADSVWPGFAEFRTSVVYLKETGLVLLNAKTAPPYYRVYEGQRPGWAASAFYTLEKRQPDGLAYANERFNTDYIASAYSSEQTNGHYPYSVFFLDSLERFHGKNMKWSVEEWFSIFWHEVFHNFQETQYGAGLDSSTITDFSKIRALVKDPKYVSGILGELGMISSALKETDVVKKRRLACQDVLKSRERRYRQLRREKMPQAIQSEQYYETSEGTARYVEELLALAVAHASEPARELSSPRLNNHPEFHEFKQYRVRTLEDYYVRIKKLRPGERYYYQVGFGLSLLLDQLAPGWKQDVFRTSGLLHAKLQQYCAGR